jgi:hypothetical protein
MQQFVRFGGYIPKHVQLNFTKRMRKSCNKENAANSRADKANGRISQRADSEEYGISGEIELEKTRTR